MKLLIKCVVLLSLVGECGLTIAQDTTGRCITSSTNDAVLESLTSVYTVEDIRVFYTTTGINALVDARDVDGSGIPDYVENVARQALVARQLFNHVGFRDPLESNRYRDVDFVDIQIRPGGGVAFDEAWIHTHSSLQHASGCRLIIGIPNSINDFPGNYYTTVAHEVFHLYQNSYTMLKVGWLVEGTANWAERALRMGATTTSGAVPLPSTKSQIENDVFGTTNPCKSEFWDRLFSLMDQSNGLLTVPAHLNGALYANGLPVIKDSYWKGVSFVLALFQYLDAEDDLISQENGWQRYAWAEVDQKNPLHNMRIINAIQRVVLRSGINIPEVEAFLAIQ